MDSKEQSVFSQNMTNIIFPKLENIANELIEREEVSIIAAETRPKALTFLHLSLIPLLLELSNSSEEFFKSSRVSTMKESKGNLDLEILKNWAKTDAFQKLIHDYEFLDEGYGNIGFEEFRRGHTKLFKGNYCTLRISKSIFYAKKHFVKYTSQNLNFYAQFLIVRSYGLSQAE